MSGFLIDFYPNKETIKNALDIAKEKYKIHNYLIKTEKDKVLHIINDLNIKIERIKSFVFNEIRKYKSNINDVVLYNKRDDGTLEYIVGVKGITLYDDCGYLEFEIIFDAHQNIEKIIQYRDGRKNGISINFYKNHIKEFQYWENRVENGLYICFIPNITYGFYRSGEKIGKWYEFCNENLYSIKDFDNSIKYQYKGYFSIPEHEFINDKIKDNYYFYYNSDGILISEGEYINGKHTGKWINYYNNGEIHEKLFLKDDVGNGEYITYHQNGKIKEKGQWIDDKDYGIYEKYDEDGKLELYRDYS